MPEMHRREHKEGQQSQTKVMLSGVKREKDRQNDTKSQLVITKWLWGSRHIVVVWKLHMHLNPNNDSC